MLPQTIKHPAAFRSSLPAGFDGVMEYGWINDALKSVYGAGTKMKGMDFDCVLERHGHFLVMESKDPGAPVPEGQQITLRKAWESGLFSIFFLIGKKIPVRIRIRWERGFKLPDERHYIGRSRYKATNCVTRWLLMAEEYRHSHDRGFAGNFDGFFDNDLCGNK